LERGLDDLERTRAIFELAIDQAVLDMPELLWKAYIDFEEEEGEYDRTRQLYERLLDKTDHVKVWISYAHFEINIPDEDEEEVEEEDEEKPVSELAKKRARKVFERALKSMKDKELKEEVRTLTTSLTKSSERLTSSQRVSLLNAWLSFERTHGSVEDIEKVQKQMPRKTKRRRKLDDDSYEEYIDYVFPADDRQTAKLSNLLAMAQSWKQAGGGITGDAANGD
jgi:crooked neck